MCMVTYKFSDFYRLFMVAYGHIWLHMDVYSWNLWSFLISLCSVRFCDFKFNMATREGVSTRDAVCVLSFI